MQYNGTLLVNVPPCTGHALNKHVRLYRTKRGALERGGLRIMSYSGNLQECLATCFVFLGNS
jgi:hypothetical protein